jgi:hypothetical protein
MPRGIFIPGNVPSSKNGRRWTGRYFIVSKQTQRYYKNSKKYWVEYKKEFKKLLKGKDSQNKAPYRITFKFVRKSRHKFDYINPAQTVQDQMVKYGWITDDNAEEMIPIFLEFEYNKDNPGVYINVLKS